MTDAKAVEQVAFLDWGCLALLCDGFKLPSDDLQLQIHPKLSPYKATFVISDSGDDLDSDKEDLKDLISHLNGLLRTGGINTITLRSRDYLKDLQVPFIINVDKTSLKNGIVHVKNKFTTLVESVHMSRLVEHISSLCS